MERRIFVKKILIPIVFILTAAVSLPAAGITGAHGELGVKYEMNPDDSGFVFDGLTLELAVPLSPDEGIEGNLQFNGGPPFTAYYYRYHILKSYDELHLGRFVADWSSGNSLSLTGSLAGQEIDRYSTGTGLKYRTTLEKALLVSSVTTTARQSRTMLSGRLIFQPAQQWQAGVALAALDLFSDDPRQAVQIDAVYTGESFTVLGEAVISNLNSGTGDYASGFYIEGSYPFSPACTGYAGLFFAEELNRDLLVAGIRHRPVDHITLQAEAVNSRDNWEITLRFGVRF